MASTAHDYSPNAGEGVATWPCLYQEILIWTGRAWNVLFSLLALALLAELAERLESGLASSRSAR